MARIENLTTDMTNCYIQRRTVMAACVEGWCSGKLLLGLRCLTRGGDDVHQDDAQAECSTTSWLGVDGNNYNMEYGGDSLRALQHTSMNRLRCFNLGPSCVVREIKRGVRVEEGAT